MFPKQIEFPEFVADQLLTSEHLNQVFNYLDEQERMTRTNLIGIGIVCGLNIKTNAAGTSITITKGCGVTSEGYLISIPDSVYTEYRVYDPVKERYYDKFVDIATKKKKFDLFELVPSAVYEDSKVLSEDFLKDKVVLLFVELLEEQNKNCDPNSCDDKGINVTVTFRPLVVSKSDLESLNATTDCIKASSFSTFAQLPLPRWNVPNTNSVLSEDIIKAYISILSNSFINTIQTTFTGVYNKIKPLIIEEFSSDPFLNLAADFAFINDGSITTSQALHTQYYYDFFSDLIQAYEEFCKKGSEVFCRNCCPDASLFPRHLLLGEAIPSGDTVTVYRHYFIYSPLFDQKDMVNEIKSLFRRLVFMYRNRNIPAPVSADDNGIKITPSKFGSIPFSEKSIPYYYTPNKSPDILYKEWDNVKTRRSRAKQNLSYNAPLYNNTDDFVLHPLIYDLEPYNFFRIEGITGKDIKTVSKTIDSMIENFRLPFQIVSLATGSAKEDKGDDCCCGDIDLEYKLLRNKILCCIKEGIRFWGSRKKKDSVITTFAYQYGEFNKEGDVSALSFANQTENPTLRLFGNEPEAPTTENSAYAPLNSALISDPGAGVNIEGIGNIPPNPNFLAGEEPKATGNENVGNITYIRKFISELYAKPLNMAQLYLDYQVSEKINIGSLPAPKTNSPAEHINYYTLIIIDELEELAFLLDAEKIGDFKAANFSGHSEKLNKAYSTLSNLLEGYHGRAYLIEKIKINTSASAPLIIEKISAAMPVLNEDDAYKLIILILNLDPAALTLLVNRLGNYSANYTAQQYIINAFYDKLDKDGMMVPILKEPASYTSGYEDMLEQLKYGSCTCDIENLIYLAERYKFSEANYFSAYVKNHPGLQHKAGVTTGGTFVIIYRGASDHSKYFKKDEVIADFYLPYLCCSDCPPVIIQPPLPQPDPLTASASEPECDKKNTNYRVTITISGGTQPYKVDGNAIVGNSIPVIIKSGNGLTVKIEDSAGKATTLNIPAYECGSPCELPCDGEAEKCNYVLWLQRPKDRGISHITNNAEIILIDENGASINIPVLDIFQNIMDGVVDPGNYNNKFMELINRLNDIVPAHFLGKGQPMFTYDEDEQLITIERYVCQEVVIKLQIVLQNLILELIYDKEGVTFEDPKTPVKIPKFGCAKINKCSGKTDIMCKEKPTVDNISVQKGTAGKSFFNFSAEPIFDNFYWYFPGGSPVNSDKAKPKNIEINATTAFVRVIGINKDGCFAILDKTVTLPQ